MPGKFKSASKIYTLKKTNWNNKKFEINHEIIKIPFYT